MKNDTKKAKRTQVELDFAELRESLQILKRSGKLREFAQALREMLEEERASLGQAPVANRDVTEEPK